MNNLKRILGIGAVCAGLAAGVLGCRSEDEQKSSPIQETAEVLDSEEGRNKETSDYKIIEGIDRIGNFEFDRTLYQFEIHCLECRYAPEED